MPKVFLHSLLLQALVQLWTSNWAGTFIGSIRTKAQLEFLHKHGYWACLGTVSFLGYCSYYVRNRENCKLQIVDLHMIHCDTRSLTVLWKEAVGIAGDSQKFPRHPYIVLPTLLPSYVSRDLQSLHFLRVRLFFRLLTIRHLRYIHTHTIRGIFS